VTRLVSINGANSAERITVTLLSPLCPLSIVSYLLSCHSACGYKDHQNCDASLKSLL
jgi:hypothetical protein